MTQPSRGTPLAPSGIRLPTQPAASFVARQADLRTSIRPTVAEIDMQALRHNAACLRTLVGQGVAVYGVVKADAYGHGAIEVGASLAPLVDGLAVSLVEEGFELRAAGIDAPVLVLGAFYGGCHSEVVEAGLIPVVYDRADLERFAAAPVRRLGHGGVVRPDHIDVHLKVDTGMNRLGFSLDDLEGVLQTLDRLPRLRVTGICTHLSSADGDDPTVTQGQLDRFALVLDRLRMRGLAPAVVHAANSAAAVGFQAARYSAVRPGLALYGALPSTKVKFPGLRPALSLRTRIMAVHDVAAGAPVSYGGIFCTSRPSRIATLPIGYADGYPRHVRQAEVLVRGRPVPVVGAVCMDMLMIDVTGLEGSLLGDDVILIGQQGPEAITIDDVARWAGTVNYEILCGLSKRVPRIYHDRPDDDPPSVSTGAGSGASRGAALSTTTRNPK